MDPGEADLKEWNKLCGRDIIECEDGTEIIADMDHWTDKQETRAAVDVLIRNVLYEEIPDSMFDRLDAYRKAIFEHVYTHHKQADQFYNHWSA